jgi:hypothetical protein
VVERSAGQLDSAGENHKFDLIKGELRDSFGRCEAFISNGDKIGDGTRLEGPFSITET